MLIAVAFDESLEITEVPPARLHCGNGLRVRRGELVHRRIVFIGG